jgi:methionyl-tRNA formyltransferase
MQQTSNQFIALCGNRIAIPVIRDLVFSRQLAALVIPQACTAFAEEVQPLLKESGIPILFVTKNNTAAIVLEAVKKYVPAAGLVFAFSYRVPPVVFNAVKNGFYNIHPGPLPGYRGPDPIFRQIKNRETYATVTIHKIDEGYDSGAVVLAAKIHLLPTDTHGMLSVKVAALAATMMGTLVKMTGMGIAIPSRKQDPLKAVFYKKQAADDVTINWQTMDAASITALINACNPWNKGAFTTLHQNIIRLLEAEAELPQQEIHHPPGTILSVNSTGMMVATCNGHVLLIRTVCCEEGIFSAGRMSAFGVLPGHQFGAEK